jgi:hypothetical protein
VTERADGQAARLVLSWARTVGLPTLASLRGCDELTVPLSLAQLTELSGQVALGEIELDATLAEGLDALLYGLERTIGPEPYRVAGEAARILAVLLAAAGSCDVTAILLLDRVMDPLDAVAYGLLIDQG